MRLLREARRKRKKKKSKSSNPIYIDKGAVFGNRKRRLCMLKSNICLHVQGGGLFKKGTVCGRMENFIGRCRIWTPGADCDGPHGYHQDQVAIDPSKWDETLREPGSGGGQGHDKERRYPGLLEGQYTRFIAVRHLWGWTV